MKIQEGVLDRIETSFIVMKNNIFHLILPLFILNFLFFGVIYLGVIDYINGIIGSLDGFEGETLLQILYSAEGILVIALLMFLGLLYAVLYIPFFLATIRLIHLAAHDEKLCVKENILFGFNNILNSFKTYWYIFKYIYLIPAIIFIIGGIGLNAGYFLEIDGSFGDILTTTSIGFMVIAFVLFLVFSIYRGFKSSFVLYSAVSNESFTEEDFNKNLKITDNNLLRIIGNFILIGFIIGFVSGFVSQIVGIFLPEPVNIVGFDDIFTEENIGAALNGGGIPSNINDFDIKNIDILFSYSSYIISEFFTQLISTIFIVFGFVFTYIFMKRLELESKENLNLEIINDSEIRRTDAVKIHDDVLIKNDVNN